MVRVLLVVAILAFAVSPLQADWPQYRGPARDGIAVNARLPRVWPKEAPKPLWKIPIGEGQSSPVIASGRLYLLCREANDTEVCLCLDAATGKQIWRHSYPAPFTPADPSAGKGPKSTPTVDGDRVYMLGVAGRFHCFDAASGKILWQRDFLKDFWGVERDEHGDDAYSTCCGIAMSPLIDGARLVLPVGGKKAGGMTAFDKRTGEIVWKSLTDRASYASPLVAELAGVRQIVGFTGLRMAGFDASDGKLLWDHEFPTKFEQTIITPVLRKDLVLVAGEGKPTTALRITRRDGKVTKEAAWQNKDLRTYLVSPIAVKDHLFGLNGRRQLVCIDLATGKTRWAEGDFDEFVSLVATQDHLLVLGGDGQLTVLDADPARYQVRATWQLSDDGEVWSHLAVAGNRLYVKDAKHLMCFEVTGP